MGPGKRAGFVVIAAVLLLAIDTNPLLGATAPPPAGYGATFTGVLKGTARGGTSDGCVFASRPVEGPLPSPLLAPRLITMKWSNFTVNGKPANLTLLVGTPIAGNPTSPTPVPWATGAPTGSAELTVNTPSGDFVTTPQAKAASTNPTGVLTVDVTLRNAKKKLRVRATFDCAKAGTTGDVPTQ